MNERSTQPHNLLVANFPYFRHAWLIAFVSALFIGILLHTGVSVPIPFIAMLLAVVVAASMGGRFSGLMSGLSGAALELSAYFGQIGPPALVGSPFNVLLGIAVTIAIGFYLGALRERLREAVFEIESKTEKLAEANQRLSQRVDKSTQELSIVRERLMLSQDRLRSVTKRWVDTQESERYGLAKRLHDDIGQSLTALRINLESNKQKFAGNDEALALIEASYKLVDDIIGSVRELSMSLRPSLLDDLGLAAALREYVLRRLKESGINASLTIEGSDELVDDTHGIAAYRIVQEAVSNILRRASASRVNIRIEVMAERLGIVIRENGDAPDFDAGSDDYSGMASIRERASLVGGDVQFESADDDTVIRLSLPLEIDSDTGAAA